MEVKLAKTVGFCWGVKRAVNMAQEARVRSKNKVLTHGPLIHNRRFVRKLKQEGIDVYDSSNGNIHEGTLIIRTHGIPPKTKKELIQKGFEIVDATCPHVVHAQEEVAQFSKEGYHVVIAGDQNHAEVVGLTGFAGSQVTIVGSVQEAEEISLQEPVLLIAQSTFNTDEYQKIAGVLKKRFAQVKVKNTICTATSSRQKEIIDLSHVVDAIVVVGDKISANTKRLASIAESQGKPVYFVESADDIEKDEMKSYHSVGITAGASTPEWETVAVVEKLKKI